VFITGHYRLAARRIVEQPGDLTCLAASLVGTASLATVVCAARTNGDLA
jgi:hypothetical protein